MTKYGKYVKVRVTRDVVLDEWTNVGIIIFDDNGKQVYSKLDFTRAYEKKDLTQEGRKKDITAFVEIFQTLEQVKRALNSTGHMMSSVQLTDPEATALDSDFDHLFRRLVLGYDLMEIEKKFRDKCDKLKWDADVLIKEVKEDPDWFLMEGGSDGTLPHANWHADYGELCPEITNLAKAFGGKV